MTALFTLLITDVIISTDYWCEREQGMSRLAAFIIVHRNTLLFYLQKFTKTKQIIQLVFGVYSCYSRSPVKVSLES